MYNLELRPLRRHFWDNEFDKVFDSIGKAETLFDPPCEIMEEETNFKISLDIPGLSKSEVEIEVRENHLYVTGERKSEISSENEHVIRSEKRYGKFSRVFTLPPNVNPDLVQARFDKGVLEITLPKEEKTQTRKISISDPH